MAKIKPGTIYEIMLDIEKYVYVCRFNEFELGLFDIVSKIQLGIDAIKDKNIIDYKSVTFIDKLNKLKDEKQVRNKWKKVGEIDVNDFKYPDVAVFNPWKQELSYENCEILKGWRGPKLKVSLEEYKKIMEAGLWDGTIDNFILYERYISRNIDNIINNKPLEPGGEITSFGL